MIRWTQNNSQYFAPKAALFGITTVMLWKDFLKVPWIEEAILSSSLSQREEPIVDCIFMFSIHVK